QQDIYRKLASGATIPITGGNSADVPFQLDANMFPSGTTLAPLFYGMAEQVKNLGKPKVAVLACAELPSCAGLAKTWKAVGEKAVGGVKVVNTGKISATAPNYTAQCLAAKNAGAQAMMVGHSSDVIARVADSCA